MAMASTQKYYLHKMYVLVIQNENFLAALYGKLPNASKYSDWHGNVQSHPIQNNDSPAG